MNGKLVTGVIVLLGVIAGGAMYYLQVYGYYREVPATGAGDVQLITIEGGVAEPVAHSDFRAIDADSSPIRYRACFVTPVVLDDARARYVSVPGVQPRIAPGWFDCFDAQMIGDELKAGTMDTFLSAKNVFYGVDRVVAITSDGRGFVWNTLNECGKKNYEGTVVGEECPPLPERDK